jgi:tRNA uridine 5-carbamoylmethylation protein Kti12
MKKIAIINRAVPGSGKTTLTKNIVKELKNNNLDVVIHSTDEYFMENGKYMFDINKLEEYHKKNFQQFTNSIKQGFDVVICDNTNIAPWQTEPYTKIARENGYKVIIFTLNPRELQKHIDSQKVTPEKPDAHGVGEDVLKRMIDEYYIYDDLLNPRTMIDKDKHIQYTWDIQTLSKKEIGLAKHFDCDVVFRVMPWEYHHLKDSIGLKFLEIIKGLE